jgi:small subunit ribosomal protein S17e
LRPPKKVGFAAQPAISPKPRRPETPAQQNRQPATNQAVKMGRVRTKTVKKSAKVIIERYYPKLTLDFETNKRVCDEIAIIASKRLRNKVRF